MATITKRLSFENLLPYASMGKDTDGDGVVDGWTKVTDANASASWLFDDTEKAQVINVTAATGTAVPAVETTDFISVVADTQYTFSAYIKAEGNLVAGASGTGPQIEIAWYDSSQVFLSSDVAGVFTDTDLTRQSITATAPSNAAYAKVRIVFRCNDSSAYGTVWGKWAQFQEGTTATDYEETDFFEIINPAGDANDGYTYGWEKTSAKKYDGVYAYKTVASGQYPAIAFRFRTPPNAENIRMNVWVDGSEMAEGDRLDVYDGGAGIAYVSPGTVGFGQITGNFRRGEVFLMFLLRRATSGVGNAYIDRFEVVWDEGTANPAPTPPVADRVYSIDFESEEYDSFFRVREQASAYNYGFTRRYDQRNSGFYSFGVKDHDVDIGYPENGSPPTIPKGEKAAFSFSFKIPISAINPALQLYAFFDAGSNGNTARIIMNGSEVWSTSQRNGWEKLDFPLVSGMQYTVVIEYEKATNSDIVYTDAIYIDDIAVYYNIPDKPLMYVATAPTTEIKTTSTSFSVQETFENTTINKFFTVKNPSKLKSGGGPSQYPETGWTRTSLESYQGGYAYRAIYPGNGEDSAVDFTFKVPHGVKNAKVEWWNFVELERSKYVPSGAKYNRLYEEYRIWVNYSLWKDFHYCSPSLTNSVHYTGPESKGDPANDYACPWGRWWKETLNLTPGRTYTLTFELQRDSGDSSDIHGRNLCVIDNLTVSWTETPGDVITVPPQPLIYFDGRDGFSHLYDRNGAEMAPLSFAEYKVFGVPGSIHQFTQVEPREVDFPIMIEGESPEDVRQKVRELTSLLGNKPLTLINVDIDGNARMLNCWLSGITGRESPDEHFNDWKKVVLSFRAFDPFWYGDWVVVDGAGPENEGFPTEVFVNNPGDAEAWPTFKLYGPITDPQVQLVDPNDDLNIYAEFKLTGFTIPSGRYVVVDTRPGRKTIILDDGQNLYQYLDPSINQLFSIPPGEYVVDLDGSSTDSNTKIVVEFQPPYWGV